MEIPTWSAPSTKLNMNLRLPIRSSVETDSPPQTILQAMSKLTLYRLQERARQEVESGEVVKATKHLQYLATNLISQGQRELAQAVLVEADSVSRYQKFSKEGDKRIKYGTRALLLPNGPERDSL
jgi:Ca-activated chloride channel family protein